ncbi:MAG TPA: family 65 glycosyl hydrolase domain-containing protein [Prolixibacteraceae bacterium]|nr:family 65 glycosyl hydrolase domain-containing protein [Prolixibacteraceae bacterium]HPS13406.1 family 65 glycosyl hydrolase domain-containing protein [Prolixibacteraceae bacterium]
MKNYLIHDEWKIIEDGFHPEYNKISESIFSLGNGRMGGRGNFEEKFSGSTLLGNYIAGVYYPDKTRVGWWKNGYPEYFAKVLNAADWVSIGVAVDGAELDLATIYPESFRRELDMKQGTLSREFVVSFPDGKQVKVSALRFLSMVRPEIGVIRYSVEPLNFSGTIRMTPSVDFDISNEDSNYDEKFWKGEYIENIGNEGYLAAHTRKTNFLVCSGMKFLVQVDGKEHAVHIENQSRDKYIASSFDVKVKKNSVLTIYKYGVNASSEYYPRTRLFNESKSLLNDAFDAGFDALLEEHTQYWAGKWETGDIKVEGDVAAQQGIRFNIFQMNQTYTGEDERLNIGPKGFTGEKYGGSTYWDTEAFCFPFYLATADPNVSRNLLVYRYKQLQKAIENGQKLGFNNGAALFPMVTINGEECHNEWEITFEEIHRNGAIAFAIYQYVNYTGDRDYLASYGFEVLLAISRFWSQRVNWSAEKQKFVMLGVTGPNEYENNVNNNWYTNKLAVWTLKYTLETIDYLKEDHPEALNEIYRRCHFDEKIETLRWKEIIEKMYFAWDEKRQIFLQQDGFLDKELTPADQINPAERPISQHWSWDRILRSPYIKQADVLQGLYLFESEYDKDFITRHFNFYEPLTVHESSLSSCIHTILAASIGNPEKAYEMYLRASRLDLDDYNNDTSDGLHITSMGGTWMAIVIGFGGLRVNDGVLTIKPFIPDGWKAYSFRISFRGAHLDVKVSRGKVEIVNHSPVELQIGLENQIVSLKKSSVNIFEYNNSL